MPRKANASTSRYPLRNCLPIRNSVPLQRKTNTTRTDLYAVSETALPHERLQAFLFNRINTPRFFTSLVLSKAGERLPDPFISAQNLPPNQRAIIRSRTNEDNKPPMFYRENIGHVLRGEIDMLDGSEMLELSLLACNVQSVELEQERYTNGRWVAGKDLGCVMKKEGIKSTIEISQVSLDVFVFKGEFPDGKIEWKILARIQANNFGMRFIRIKGVERQDSQLEENLLRAELWIVMRTEVGQKLEGEELKVFEKLLTWEVCVELLKHEARCLTGKEKRCFNPMLHMGIEGSLFGMKRIEESFAGSEDTDAGDGAGASNGWSVHGMDGDSDEDMGESGESTELEDSGNAGEALPLRTKGGDGGEAMEVNGEDVGHGSVEDDDTEIADSQETESEPESDAYDSDYEN